MVTLAKRVCLITILSILGDLYLSLEKNKIKYTKSPIMFDSKPATF